MSGINELLTSIGGSALGSLGSQIGYGIGEITGYNEKLRQDQLRQQQALTSMQYAANYNLMKESYEQQLQMWNNTNYEAQIKHLQQAGLNPALLYAKGGAGGTTGSGSASVGGGQASNSAQMQQANTAQAMQGMAMMKVQSEIKLNEAQAEKLKAEAQTTTEIRPELIQETRSRGYKTWLEGIRMEFENTLKDGSPQEMRVKHQQYGETWIDKDSLFSKTKIAELSNALGLAELNNQKAQGYLQELLNATKNSDSQATQAAASKLAAEFNYGEYTNWKYWVQLGKSVTNDVISGIGEFYNPIKTVKTIRP